ETRRPCAGTSPTAGSRARGLKRFTEWCWTPPAPSTVRRPMQHVNASRAVAEPSLLAKALERNPAMLEAAIRLHQEGAIPPSTHLIDLDAVARNASAIVGAARRFGLTAFAMTKQDGHEPHLTGVVLERGFDGVTAVEAMQAYRIHRHGFPLGNVGHTSQLPRGDVLRIL